MSTQTPATDLTIPVFVPVSNDVIALITSASRIVVDETDEADAFALLVERMANIAVAAAATIVIPERVPGPTEQENFSFLSKTPLMFCKVQGTPGARSTFGICSEYSEGYGPRPLVVGALIRFPTPDFFLVVKGVLLDATSTTVAILGEKRPHQELSVDGGNQLELMPGEKNLAYIYDLDGVGHPTRSKKDITQRAADLYFGFRVVEKERWTHLMGMNLELQPTDYLRMIEEQARTRSSAREAAFASCGMVSRIRDLRFSENQKQLKFLLTGAIITGGDDCLSLHDFESKGFPIATGRLPDVRSNENLATTLRNLEAVMVVFYSSAFLGVFAEILGHIEGFARPLELVSADFLKHSVETELSKFFRVTRSQIHSYDTTMRMSSPKLCALNLTSFINNLVKDLSNDIERARNEEYFLLNLRIEESSSKSTAKYSTRQSTASSLSASSTTATAAAATEMPLCGSHIGALLKATHSRTNTVFVCKAGDSCKFQHVAIDGKSKKEIIGMIATLPPVMRAALMTAAKKRT